MAATLSQPNVKRVHNFCQNALSYFQHLSLSCIIWVGVSGYLNYQSIWLKFWRIFSQTFPKLHTYSHNYAWIYISNLEWENLLSQLWTGHHFNTKTGFPVKDITGHFIFTMGIPTVCDSTWVGGWLSERASERVNHRVIERASERASR